MKTLPQSTFISGANKSVHEINPERPFTQYQAWLAETSGVLGCPIDCKYCFFQVDGLTPVKPVRGLAPELMIAALKEQPTYLPNMPIHFGSKTDAFSTRATIDYYSEILRLYGASEYPNPIIFITKKLIPDKVLEIACRVRQPVLFYLSFSGLDGTPVEPLVNGSIAKQNFIRVKDYGLTAVHYWRPFVPQNSQKDQLHAMLDFVSTHASCSVLNGLRLSEGIREHMLPFWPELAVYSKGDIESSGEFWPENVRAYLITLVREMYPSYAVFFGNTPCSIAHSLGQPDLCGHFNEPVCIESSCPQRELCSLHHRAPSVEAVRDILTTRGMDPNSAEMQPNRVVVRGTLPSELMTLMRFALRFPVVPESIDYSAGYNWANVQETRRIVEVPWAANWIR